MAFDYDGGTDLSKIRIPKCDEALLFTDGLSSLSAPDIWNPIYPAYTITSSPKSNHDFLKSLAEKTGARSVNLQSLSVNEAVTDLSQQILLFLGVKNQNAVKDYYPSGSSAVSGGFSLAGIAEDGTSSVTLQFGYGKQISFEKEITLISIEQSRTGIDIGRLFGQKKIRELEKNRERNKVEIMQLAKQYRIVTSNTSLLVLETVADYVRYGVEPPRELLGEYKALIRQRREEMTARKNSALESSFEYTKQLWNWWKTSFPVKASLPFKRRVDDTGDTTALLYTTADMAVPVEEHRFTIQPPPDRGVDSKAISEAISGRVAGVSVSSRRQEEVVTTNIPPKNQIPEETITIREHTSNADYIQDLLKLSPEKRYHRYLELRIDNLTNPTFFYETAGVFLKSDRKLGVQILTNLAELDFENHEIHKLLGFRLREIGESEASVYIFKKVIEWRPQEPQSYRDYALALEDCARYQDALDTMYLALTNEYENDVMANYRGIEEVIVTEINNMILTHRELNISAIDKRILHAMPVDIRVVLGWNMNDSDMDLWVTDPKGEKSFYSNRLTAIGGRISEDFTNGYGPEQFMLKKAQKGKYIIEVDYYGESGAKIAGKTTLYLEIFTSYGRAGQQRKQITLQLSKDDERGVYVGEFVF